MSDEKKDNRSTIKVSRILVEVMYPEENFLERVVESMSLSTSMKFKDCLYGIAENIFPSECGHGLIICVIPAPSGTLTPVQIAMDVKKQIEEVEDGGFFDE